VSEFFTIQAHTLEVLAEGFSENVRKSVFKAYQISLREAVEASKNEMQRIYSESYPSVPKNLIRGQTMKDPNTGKSLRKRSGGLIRAFINFPSDKVEDAIAGLQVSGKAVDLMELKPKQFGFGVRYKGLEGKPINVKSAFIQNVFGSGRNVYRRTTKARFPVRRLWPIAPIQVFNKSNNQERILNFARNRFVSRYQSRIDFFIEKGMRQDLLKGAK
jgi:hypothetical protein